MERNSRIYIAGNRGLVGSAIERRLRREHDAVITSDIADFDLTDARATDDFFARTQPEYVFVAAAKVGGIKANDSLSRRFHPHQPADSDQPRSTPPFATRCASCFSWAVPASTPSWRPSP
jgi:hypothetical protein